MAYNLHFENHGFILEHTGITTIDEINEINALVHGHEKFDAHDYQIVNLLGADFSIINQGTARMPAATDWGASKTRANVKIALVAQESNAIAFCKGYISESQEMGSPWRFRLFDQLNDAYEWVGI